MSVTWINLKKFLGKMEEHNIGEYTAQCAYYAVLSFIPFIMLIVTLIQYSGISKDLFVSIIQNIIPATMADETIGIVQEVYSKSIGTISISAIFVLWSARKSFYALSKGLHSIYETDKEYNFFVLQLKSLVLTVFLVLAIISALVISVFGNSILGFLDAKFNIPDNIMSIFHVSKMGIYVVLFIIFLLMYRFVPGHKQGIKRQIPGAIVATIGWYIISLFFSMYLDAFKGFSVMYGSLTTIVLSMMWVYFCMYIILIGAEINNLHK